MSAMRGGGRGSQTKKKNKSTLAQARAVLGQHPDGLAIPAFGVCQGDLGAPCGGTHCMILAKVELGRVQRQGVGGELIKPGPGFHSVTSADSIYAVFDNGQSYPAYVIHYT
mmetsp:Transcript_22884/g.71309  ORF Transcript_22884/g.71309 Transcript_22884/m.71309 type:complete len:111 (-) Transcript_22884:145-477(-)